MCTCVSACLYSVDALWHTCKNLFKNFCSKDINGILLPRPKAEGIILPLNRANEGGESILFYTIYDMVGD